MGIARVGQMTAPIPIWLLLRAGVAPDIVLIVCGVTTLISLFPLVMAYRVISARAPK